MKWLKALPGLILIGNAWGTDPVSLEETLRIVSQGPRIAVSLQEIEAARADRLAAGALPNPSVSIGRTRPASGDRTVVDAASQDQAGVEIPIPVFGQRGARVQFADQQVARARSQSRLVENDVRRQAALAFTRLLGAQETRAARRAALDEVERIRSLVAGRLESGVASRYDLSRADAEVAVGSLALQRVEADIAEQGALLAALANRPGWRPRAAGSLAELQRAGAAAESATATGGPAAQAARDETLSAEARIELAHRERFPVPSLGVARTWTRGPFGAANFIGLSSEIPIFDSRRGQEDRARAEAIGARERERATLATLRAERERHLEALRARRAALERFEREVFQRQSELLEMAESAYRLGRATLFELLDARRTQLEASTARIELLQAIVESQLELRALSGDL